MAITVAALLFGTYVTNVIIGAFTGTQYLSDVTEALILFVASIFFVAAILRAEAQKKNKNNTSE